MRLIEKTENELSDKEILTIEKLIFTTWPPPDGQVMSDKALLEDFHKRPPGKTSYLLQKNEDLVGYAETFLREIHTEKGPLLVNGLGAVCVSKKYRGQGLGAKIVQYIFEKIALSKVPICLFQTAVPGFYERLNCKQIKNTFFNSSNRKNPEDDPFWDPFRMVFPVDYDWPEGKIDLNGKGF